ncbi:unnamed protein product [Peronospora farinosa]|uniref:Uncharacterized protein n=1 Tax=Peronospora farinosa TaxID=134698 RepID=A0ABN8BX65_9STRA|nr:unnamed protein product [Peronospora farinosa]
MRANDIPSMVLVTKLLLNRDASSTPTNYLLLNSHSLIDDDKNDEIQALRVDSDSDTHQERGLTFTFDSVLKFLPWTVVHEAAQAAISEQHVLAQMIPGATFTKH